MDIRVPAISVCMKTLQLAIALLVAASAAQAAPAPSGAAADPMAAFYGNTLPVAVPAGYYYASRFIEPDGTWTETRGASRSRGRWYIEGDQVCSVQTEPAIVNVRRYCWSRSIVRQPGDEWVTTDPDTGNDVIQRIEIGRKPAG